MPAYLLPIIGLKTDADVHLDIGAVQLLGRPQANAELENALPGNELPGALAQEVDGFAREFQGNVTARVEAPDRDDAVDLVETALDVLRGFLYGRALAQMPSFGIRQGVLGGSVRYADLDAGGIGWFRIGHVTGVGLTEETCSAFDSSPFNSVCGAAVGTSDISDAQRRGLIAIRLASQALLSHDPGLQTVLSMTAAEVLLFGPTEDSAKFQLARRAAFLLCGSPEDKLCGRGRDSCVILTTDPNAPGGKKATQKLRALGNYDYTWRCSEWHRVLDWYDSRSAVVHHGHPVSRENASPFVYWLLHDLIPQALRWFSEHPNESISALLAELARLPEPPADQLEFDIVYNELASRGAFKQSP